MVFRFRKLQQLTAVPKDFNTLVSKVSFTKDGTKVQDIVSVPVASLGNDIPNPEDYKLSKLINAGVPLTPVSANILDEAPSESEANAFLDGLPSDVSTDDVNNNINDNKNA